MYYVSRLLGLFLTHLPPNYVSMIYVQLNKCETDSSKFSMHDNVYFTYFGKSEENLEVARIYLAVPSNH